jgi:hypothetical protein
VSEPTLQPSSAEIEEEEADCSETPASSPRVQTCKQPSGNGSSTDPPPLMRVQFPRMAESLPSGVLLVVSEAEARCKSVVLFGRIVGPAGTD